MSDTNRVGLRVAKTSATAFPVTLAPNELDFIRFTGAPNLAYQPSSITSNQINDDRNVSDTILVDATAGGDFNFELSSHTFDDLIAGAMLNTWTNAPRKTGSSEITATGAGTITLDDATDFQTGFVVKLENVGTIDVGQGVYTISVAGSVLTLTPYDANTNAMTASATIAANTTCKVTGFKATANGEISIAVAGGVATLSASGGSSLGDYMGSGSELVAGQWIKLAGFVTAANNVWARVVSADGTNITFNAPTGAATDAAATEQVEIFFGDYVSNGAQSIDSHKFLVERRFSDHSPVTREAFLQMAVAQMSLNLQPGAIATGTISFLGSIAQASTTPSELYSGGTPTDNAEPDTRVYNTSSNVGRIGRDDDVIGVASNFVLDATIEINANLREKKGVGVLGAVGIGIGEFAVSGTLTTHFDDKAILDALLAQTETSFDLSVVDADGRAMVIDLPRIKYTTGAPDVPGKNTDVTLAAGYQAIKSAALGYTMLVQRLAFAA